MPQPKKISRKQDSLRQNAESALHPTPEQVRKMTAQELQHLVHELQVHQRGLEMQNEVLRRAQLDLEMKCDRYATLFDFMPVGYVTLNGGGRIQEANLTFCHLLGLSRGPLLRTPFEKYVDPDDQGSFRLYLNTLQERATAQSSDVLTLRHAGHVYRVRLKGCPETTEPPIGKASLIRIAVEDVTVWEGVESEREEQKLLVELVVSGAMDAIVTTDEHERIVLFNHAAEKMFRVSAASVLGQPVDRLIPERFRLAHHGHFQQFRQNVERVRHLGAAREILGLRADGEEFPIEVTISQVELKGKGKKLFAVVLRDVTERRQAQETLEREKEFIKQVLDSAGALVVILDPDRNILRMNRACEQTVLYSFENLKGKPFWNLWDIPPADDNAGRLPAVFEAALMNKSAQLNWILWNTTAIFDKTGAVKNYIATGTDITLRKQAEQNLQATHQALAKQKEELKLLTDQLLNAQEEERRRISRDLHDDVNQRLALLSFKLQTAHQGLPESHSSRQVLTDLYQDVAQLSDDVRYLAYQYHPSILDDLGLEVALRSLSNDFSRWQGLPVTLRASNVPKTLPSEVASCLYRVAQEGLRNISRHAQPLNVRLELSGEQNGLTLSLHDDGQGFSSHEGQSEGLGLVSMGERVRLVNGKLRLESQPGQGTTVWVWVPLGEPKP